LILSGLDEAGLGPLLGPYCAALISLRYNGTVKDPRKLCYSVLREQPEPGKLAVGDSKQIYSPGKILELEQTVLTFFSLYCGDIPKTAEQLLKTILKDEPKHEVFRKDLPWNSFIQSTGIPLAADPKEITRLRKKLAEQFSKKELSLERLSIRMIPPGEFNNLLESSRNKAEACQTILAPLMKAGAAQEGKIIVDRQGGRRYYGEWLIELFPGKLIAAGQEGPQRSLYQVDHTEVSFQVKADALYFETALASMAAKYVREVYMHGFNLYWQSRLSGLKGTAGYYNDGKRFIAELKEAGILPEETSFLIRKK
jgi:ribonuclease HII